jgi:hypothetical protein
MEYLCCTLSHNLCKVRNNDVLIRFLGFNLSSGGVVVRILITTLPKNLREAKADTHGEHKNRKQIYTHFVALCPTLLFYSV